MDKVKFGNSLKDKRIEMGKTQGECARECGVCLEAYQKWERGLSFPRPDKYEKIVECLGVNAND